ncbi:hypothetical protein QEN19_001494 [Hanseniaspora menglaensis]
MSRSFSKNKKRAVATKKFEFSSSDEDDMQIKTRESSPQEQFTEQQPFYFNNVNSNIRNPNINLESSFVSNHDSVEQIVCDLSFSNKPLAINSSLVINTTKNFIQDSSLVNSLLNSYTHTSKVTMETGVFEEQPIGYESSIVGQDSINEDENNDSLDKNSIVLKDLDNFKGDSSESCGNEPFKQHKNYLKNRYKRYKKKQNKKVGCFIKDNNEQLASEEENTDQYSNNLINEISASFNTPIDILDSSEKQMLHIHKDKSKFKSQKSLLKSFINEASAKISKEDEDALIFSLGEVREDLLRQEKLHDDDNILIDETEKKRFDSKEKFAVERRNMNIEHFSDILSEIIIYDKLPFEVSKAEVIDEWKYLGYRLHKLVYNFVEEQDFFKYIEMYEKNSVIAFLTKTKHLNFSKNERNNKMIEFIVKIATKILDTDFDKEEIESFTISDDLEKYLIEMKSTITENKDKLKKGITGLYFEQEYFIIQRYFFS